MSDMWVVFTKQFNCLVVETCSILIVMSTWLWKCLNWTLVIIGHRSQALNAMFLWGSFGGTGGHFRGTGWCFWETGCISVSLVRGYEYSWGKPYKEKCWYIRTLRVHPVPPNESGIQRLWWVDALMPTNFHTSGEDMEDASFHFHRVLVPGSSVDRQIYWCSTCFPLHFGSYRSLTALWAQVLFQQIRASLCELLLSRIVFPL